jgi:flavin-dependent dehydrogenase
MMKNFFFSLMFGSTLCSNCAEQVVATLRDIPVLYETDVVMAGGSSAAVAAACAAADRGAQVVLIAPRPYLGDDLCGQQLLWLADGEAPETSLAQSLFPNGRVTTPFTVKSALDQALLKRGVRYLTGCHVTDLLVDDHGRVSGVVIVNRSGSQAIKAKVVIDSTRHALLARQAGAKFRAFIAGEKAFQFVVVGGELQSGPAIAGHKLDVTYNNPSSGRNTNAEPVYEYTVKFLMNDNRYSSFAQAEQAVRNQVSGVGMVDCSEYAFCFPTDTIMGERRVDGNWTGASHCDVNVFRPQGLTRLYVLSEYADVCALAQPGMLRPLSFLTLGELVGNAAAIEAKPLSHSAVVQLADVPSTTALPLTIGESRNVMVPVGKASMVKGSTRALPLLGNYDVVVVGGGTAGAPAGIGAARTGAKTLVIEYLDELGGVGTAGLIASYWYGNKNGFTKEIETATGGNNRWPMSRKGGWNVAQKSEWLRHELLKVNAEIWLSSFGCGAVLDKGKVTGVVIVTPFGRGVVRAKTVIDATGNADIADCAGAETQFGVAPGGMLSVQLAGFPPRNLGDNVNNTCYAMVDDTSVLDIWHLMTWTRTQTNKAAPYDVGQLLDSRERRRIVADYMLTTPDILNHRSFPDTISHHKSNFDAAAFPTSPMLLIKDMKGPAYDVDLPYRSLLPKGLDGILVTGLGAGAERDAMTLIRMQADLQNQGYAAGVAAATAAANGGHTRAINIKQLQQQLVTYRVLEERVLTDKDSYPMNLEAIEKAVVNVGSMSSEIKQSRTVADPSIFSLAVVMAHPDQSLPLLRQAYKATTAADKKLTYAKILGILGDKTGAPILVATLESAKNWDKGYGLTSHRESDNTFSELDRLVLALGFSGAPEGLKTIVAKCKQLEPHSELSHFIAVAMALRHYSHPKIAAEPLAQLLNEPDFTGHAMVDTVDQAQGTVLKRDIATALPNTNMNASFRELLVAGMLVHCGDHRGMGRKVLEQYRQGIEGHFARYAQFLLQSALDTK